MYERLSRCAVRPSCLAAQLLLATCLMIQCSATQVQAATLEVTSATVAGKGETAKICVLLKTDGDKVAGTQNDLTWDGACATLADKDQCEANPAHGKDLNAALPSENTMRSFVLSLSDVDTIPDTELYCCNFRSELSAAGSCCDIGISRTGASTPDGVAIDTTGKPGKICLGKEAPAAAAQAPVATEQPAPGIAPWMIALVVVVVIAVAAGVMFSRKS